MPQNVLVIEDDKNIRGDLVSLLEEEGFIVDALPNGKMVLETIMNKKFVVVLCDIMMPGVDGYEVLQLLRKSLKPFEIPPFIFLTARIDRVDFRKGMQLGADDFITKPYKLWEIVNAIHTQVTKRIELMNSGLPSEILVKVDDIIDKGFAAKITVDDKKTLQVGCESIEESIPHRDGKVHHYELHKFVLPESNQKNRIGEIAIDITERKRMEEELIISNNELVSQTAINQKQATELNLANKMLLSSFEQNSLLMEHSPIGIELYDADGKLVKVNSACSEMFGIINAGEASRFSLFDDPEISAKHKKELKLKKSIQYQAYFDFDKVKEQNLYQTSKSGQIYLHTIITPIRKGGEAIKGYLVQIQDFNDRKLTEQALLRESEVRYNADVARNESVINWQSTFDGIQASIFLIDVNGKILLANKAFESLLGKSQEEITGHFCYELVHETECFDDNCPFKKVKISNKRESKDFLINEKWYSVLIDPIFNDDKKITSAVHIMTDITERKNTENNLRKSELRSRSITASANAAIITATNKGTITEWNKGAETIFGYTETEAVGKKITIIIPEEYVEKHINGLNLVAMGGEPQMIGKTVELKGFNKNWKEFPIELSLAEWETIEGKYFTAIIRDITVRKQAELLIQHRNSQLKEINATKDRLFSIIAHDLRSPFTVLLGLTKVMATNGKEYTSEEVENFSNTLHRSAVNIYQLIKDLLVWAQLQKGVISVSATKFSLSETYLECKEAIEQNISHKKITILSEIPEEMKIFADENMIKSLLRNLLSNALKFTNKGGEIVARARETDDGMIEVAITNTGDGIPEGILAKLFIDAEGVGPKSTEDEPSTGLGLLLCKEFVELHHGNIWVENEKGKGSTFYFTLPKIDLD